MTDAPKLGFQKLHIYEAALELARLVARAEIRDAELRDQATRAAKSVFLQTAEGLPARDGLRRRSFNLANGSLHETIAALDLARALGAIDAEAGAAALRCAARVWQLLGAMLGAISRPSASTAA